MNLVEHLNRASVDIVFEAVTGVGRARLPHYAQSGEESTRARLDALYELLLNCLRDKTLIPIINHGERVARERFEAGFGLGEVQAAFNVLEEALWKFIVRELHPDELAEALGSVGTILGAGKDALARTYVSLATGSQAPSLDLEELFKGN